MIDYSQGMIYYPGTWDIAKALQEWTEIIISGGRGGIEKILKTNWVYHMGGSLLWLLYI